MYSLIQVFWFSGIIFLFNSSRHRPFCLRNYNVLCVLTLLFARNAVGVVFQHSLHGITCQRGNRNGEVLLERGYLLLGDQYIILNLMALVWRLSPGCALICAFSSSLFALLAELAVRDPDYAMATGVLFHLIVGLYASYSCHLRELFAREHFALKKEIKFLSDQNASLLYTLIPPNVVERLSSHAEQHFLCGEIKQCTIMFCALERQSELAFARLNDIFSAFDAAVTRSGLFKYQHVGQWFIVACPRAARPFDDDAQFLPYPDSFLCAMVWLAEELQAIAARHALPDRSPLRLRAGIHIGPAAGAVIGTHRAFYCLYGDTINLAARICTAAANGGILATAAFATAAGRLCPATLGIEPCGPTPVKGKGLVDTFRVWSAVPPPHTAPPSAASAWPHPQPQRPHHTKKLLRMPSSDPSDAGDEVAGADREGRAPTSLSGSSSGWAEEAEHAAGSTAPTGNGKAGGRVPENGIRRLWTRVRFSDEGTEARFALEDAAEQRGALLAALGMHVVASAFQAAIASQMQGAGAPGAFGRALVRQWAAGAAACVVVAAAVWAAPASAGLSRRCFVGVLVLYLAATAAALPLARPAPPFWVWACRLTGEITFFSSWTGSLHYADTVVIAAAAVLVAGCAAWTAAPSEAGAGMGQVGVKWAFYLCGGLLLANLADHDRRERWRRLRLFKRKLAGLRAKLHDLLPAFVAQRLLDSASARLPGARARAGVLVLDVCGFTSMCGSMAAVDVADMMHRLFSAFDAAVQVYAQAGALRHSRGLGAAFERDPGEGLGCETRDERLRSEDK